MSFNQDSSKLALLDKAKLPRHVAIIMDGNGRWAKKRLMNRVRGHERGVETVRAISRACREIGIKYLTLYAFSTENWQRPHMEVSALMTLLKRFLRSEQSELLENNIRLNVIGQIWRLPKDVREVLDKSMSASAENSGMVLSLALSYGGRDEILQAVRDVVVNIRDKKLDIEKLDPELFSSYLYTKDMPDPDLLIRTSGEMRISNFLIWQIAYSEIYVTKTLWPDFSKDEFIDILTNYQQRERRFGKTSDQLSS